MEMNSVETDKKARKKNFTKDEILALCEFIKQYREKLFGRAGHCSQKVEARKKKYWEKAAEVLRSAGGRDCRSGNDLKKKWFDLKVLAKKYDIQKHKTGGGPAVEINPIYEAVLAAMSQQARDGITTLGKNENDPLFSDGSSESSQESSNSFPRSYKVPPPLLKMRDKSTPGPASDTTPGPVYDTSPGPASSASPDTSHKTIQEEILRIERAKLEIEKEKLLVTKETLNIQKEILATLKMYTLPSSWLSANEN